MSQNNEKLQCVPARFTRLLESCSLGYLQHVLEFAYVVSSAPWFVIELCFLNLVVLFIRMCFHETHCVGLPWPLWSAHVTAVNFLKTTYLFKLL